MRRGLLLNQLEFDPAAVWDEFTLDKLSEKQYLSSYDYDFRLIKLTDYKLLAVYGESSPTGSFFAKVINFNENYQPSIGPQSSLIDQMASISYKDFAVVKIAVDRVAIVYIRPIVRVVVLRVDGSNVIIGNQLTLNDFYYGSGNTALLPISNSRGVVCYYVEGKLRLRFLNFNGISVSAASDYLVPYNANIGILAAIDSTRSLFAYESDHGLALCFINLVNSTPSLFNNVVISSNNFSPVVIARSKKEENKYILIYRSNISPYNQYAVAIEVVDHQINFGNSVQIAGGNSYAGNLEFMHNSSRALFYFNNHQNNNLYLCVLELKDLQIEVKNFRLIKELSYIDEMVIFDNGRLLLTQNDSSSVYMNISK